VADGGPEVGGGVEIGGEFVKAEDDVVKFAVAVGSEDFDDGGAVVHDADTDAVFVGEGIEPD